MKQFVIALSLMLFVPVSALAEKVTIDTSTPEGRRAAYQALNESNLVGNANRMIRTLKSVQRSSQNPQLKAQADRLIPQLTQLVETLGGTTQTSNTP